MSQIVIIESMIFVRAWVLCLMCVCNVSSGWPIKAIGIVRGIVYFRGTSRDERHPIGSFKRQCRKVLKRPFVLLLFSDWRRRYALLRSLLFSRLSRLIAGIRKGTISLADNAKKRVHPERFDLERIEPLFRRIETIEGDRSVGTNILEAEF